MSTNDLAANLLQDLPPLHEAAKVADQAVEDAKLALAALKQELGWQEDAVAAEVLEDPALKNEAQRKAAVSKAIRDDPKATSLRAQLAAAQRDLANAEVAQKDADRRIKGHASTALLVGHQLADQYYANFHAGCVATLRARQHK